MTRRRLPVLPVLLGLLASTSALGACGDQDAGEQRLDAPAARTTAADGPSIRRDEDNAAVRILVGSKNFTEQKVLGELYAQGLAAAGFRVQEKLDLGDERAAQQALLEGTVDGYPEYTGTALLSLCGVSSDEVPKDPRHAYRDARACFRRKGLVALPPTPFNNSNEVGVRTDLADRLGLLTISDLRAVDQDMTLYGPPECRRRRDCLRGLEEEYGLRFKQFRPLPPAERHAVLRGGGKIASIVFTTDPQNRRQGIKLLDDDRGMFPPYNTTFVVREEVAMRAGEDLRRVVAEVQRGLTDEVMQELNARVDLDGETPRAVAAAYLREARLVGAGG